MNEHQDPVLQKLGELTGEFRSFRKEMLGNGQPGRIQNIEAKIKEIDHEHRLLKEQHERERAVRNLFPRSAQVITLIFAAILTLLVGLVSYHINQGHVQQTEAVH